MPKLTKTGEEIGSVCAVTLILLKDHLRQFTIRFKLNCISLCFDIPLRGGLILKLFQKGSNQCPSCE